MSKITFQIDQTGREYYTDRYEIELDTEDFKDYDEMRDEAYRIVLDGEADSDDRDYNDSETEGTEIVDDDYDGEDEAHEWKDESEPTKVDTPPESKISW